MVLLVRPASEVSVKPISNGTKVRISVWKSGFMAKASAPKRPPLNQRTALMNQADPFSEKRGPRSYSAVSSIRAGKRE